MSILTKENVEAILNRDVKIGDNDTWLRIKSLQPYQCAFVHRSFMGKGDFTEHNDVLEWAGDKALGFCVSTYLTQRFPLGDACFLTNVFKSLIRGSALHRFARYHNFGRYILFAPRTDAHMQNRGLGNINIYEDAFEAFIEAIIRDFGVDLGQRYARRFIVATIERCMDFSHLLGASDNYKQAVQKAFQHHKFENPVYVDVPGPRNHYMKAIILTTEQLSSLPDDVQLRATRYDAKIKRVLLRLSGISPSLVSGSCIIGVGKGTKKNIAEQDCSRTALLIIGHAIDLH